MGESLKGAYVSGKRRGPHPSAIQGARISARAATQRSRCRRGRGLNLRRSRFRGHPTCRSKAYRVRGLDAAAIRRAHARSEEHTSELQSLIRISYAVFCLKKIKCSLLIHKISKLYMTSE